MHSSSVGSRRSKVDNGAIEAHNIRRPRHGNVGASAEGQFVNTFLRRENHSWIDPSIPIVQE